MENDTHKMLQNFGDAAISKNRPQFIHHLSSYFIILPATELIEFEDAHVQCQERLIIVRTSLIG